MMSALLASSVPTVLDPDTAAPPSSSLVVILHVGGNINRPDDPSKPWCLDVRLRPPEFMAVAFVMIYGGAEIMKVRADTREELDAFVHELALLDHPRLTRLTITGPDGVVLTQDGRRCIQPTEKEPTS